MRSLALLAFAIAFESAACGSGEEQPSADATTNNPPDSGLNSGRDGSVDAGIEPCEECIALVGAQIFDGTTLRSATLILRGSTIDHLDTSNAPPNTGHTVDLTGKTILPGLIDLHVHSYNGSGPNGSEGADLGAMQLGLMLRAGVTTLLDLGSGPQVFDDRAGSETSMMTPRIHAAGPMFTVTGGHPCRGSGSDVCAVVDMPADADAAFADVAAHHPNFIKLIIEPGLASPLPTLSYASIMRLTELAQNAGIPVIAHVSHVADMVDAVAAGIRVFAHVPLADTMTEEQAAMFKTADITVVPTLVQVSNLEHLANGELSDLDDPAVEEDVPSVVLAALRDPAEIRSITSDAFKQIAAEALAAITTNFERLHAAEVKLVAGSDCGNPADFHGRSLRTEIALYREHGMSAAEALNAATKNAADLLGRADLGRIEAGATADLLIIDGDPLADLTKLGAVHSIYKGGVLVDREALNAR